MIRQRILGRTGLKVSELCLGTMNFGWKSNESESFAILDAFRAAGGNFIQAMGRCPSIELTAASTEPSERIVGRWWRSRGIPRSDLVLATRINLGRIPDDAHLVKFARDCVRESLRRLKTEYVDLLIIEWGESIGSTQETVEVFNALVREGLTRYIGAADFPTWRVADIIGHAREKNHCRMEAIQADYSLMTRSHFEPEAMSLCGEQRLGFLARSPLAGGFLARSSGARDGLGFSRREWLEQRYGNHYGESALAAVGNVAGIRRTSPARISLSWVLHNPSVTSAVIGVHSVAQLSDLLKAPAVRLSDRELELLHDATAAEEVRIGPEPTRIKVPMREFAMS